MNFKVGITLGLFLAFVNSATLRKREHPGCLIWWFAPDCLLAKMFGVDPFGIYPWEKFCKKYSDFEDKNVCKKYIKDKEEVVIDQEEVEIDQEEIEIDQEDVVMDHVDVVKDHVEETEKDDQGALLEPSGDVSQKRVGSSPPGDLDIAKRRSSKATKSLAEICISDDEFASKHSGLCMALRQKTD